MCDRMPEYGQRICVCVCVSLNRRQTQTQTEGDFQGGEGRVRRGGITGNCLLLSFLVSLSDSLSCHSAQPCGCIWNCIFFCVRFGLSSTLIGAKNALQHRSIWKKHTKNLTRQSEVACKRGKLGFPHTLVFGNQHTSLSISTNTCPVNPVTP